MNQSLTFDDIILIPQFSSITSRSEVDTGTKIAGMDLKIPIISANMSTVTELGMAKAMFDNGGLGILHRYASMEDVLKWIDALVSYGAPPVPSIGVKDEDLDRAVEYEIHGVKAICIDIAHGDSAAMCRMIDRLLAHTTLSIIAGNVVTAKAAFELYLNGADTIKVGVGPGSVCSTRIQTGHGRAQLTAIQDCATIKIKYPKVKIIADGGIRYPGDVVKALAFGADAVMVGGMLAGCEETPGTAVNGFKIYAGMASEEAQMGFRGYVGNGTAEGVSIKVPFKGPVKNVLDEIAGGLRSGLSYSGCRNIKELQDKMRYEIITSSGFREGTPHGRNQ